MKHETRLTVWRRNKANAHRMLVIRSTWDASWVVVDYNPEIPPRKFATHDSAVGYARMRVRARAIERMVRVQMSQIGGDAA